MKINTFRTRRATENDYLELRERFERLFVSVTLLSCLFVAVARNPATAVEVKTNEIENSVVKVFSTVRQPNPYQPWTKGPPVEITGSGVVIEGKRILSNAHCVLYASQVQLQGNQAGDKISATVESIAPGIDLAVLKLEDESFFDSHQALPLSKSLPDIKEAVLAYGYPEGGSSLSITKGIVSRIEFVEYNAPVSGLRIQIDAAVNPGNSGGPAVVGDHMIGLAFSHLTNAQNIGYIIPSEEIELFLQDVADGHYDGKPAMFDDCQNLENSALRAFVRAEKSVEGVVVQKPSSTEPEYPLKQWDVITHIGATPIDDQGMVKISDTLRVGFKYLVQNIGKRGKVPLSLMRGGKQLKIELPVSPTYPLVIPDLEGSYPSYFIYGPLALSVATTQFTSPLVDGSDAKVFVPWLIARGSPLLSRSGDRAAFKDENLVVVTCPFFPQKSSRGYGEPSYQVVKSVNGIPIKNLGHLVETLREATDKYITFEFNCRTGETLVFDRSEVAAQTEKILKENGIRCQGSADMLAIWNVKMAAK